MYFIDVFLYVVVSSICWKCIFLQFLRTLYEHHEKNLAIMLCRVNICNFGASFNECQGFVFLQEFQCFLPWVILACSQFVFLTCLFVCPFGSHSCADWPPAYQPFSVVELFFFLPTFSLLSESISAWEDNPLCSPCYVFLCPLVLGFLSFLFFKSLDFTSFTFHFLQRSDRKLDSGFIKLMICSGKHLNNTYLKVPYKAKFSIPMFSYNNMSL